MTDEESENEIQIPNAELIDPELRYILGAQGANIVVHPKATGTVQEKADLLGWDKSRVIKALVFKHAEDGSKFNYYRPRQKYIIVSVPGNISEVDIYKLKKLKLFQNINPKKKFSLASDLISGMDPGTCSPFVDHYQLEQIIAIVFDEEALRSNDAVDFCFRVNREWLKKNRISADQVSVQMPYSEAFRILNEQYPTKVFATQLR